MAKPAQKNKAARSADKKSNTKTPPAQTAKRAAKPDGAKPPAYMQAKLAVSHPQDSAEKEADKVAKQVSRAAKGAPKADGKPTDKKAQRASLEPGLKNAEPVPAAVMVQKREAPTAARKEENKQENTPGKGGTTNVQREAADPVAGAETSAETENRIEAKRGTGNPLPSAVAAEMGARFNRDFGAVRIHTDQEAAELCAQTRARAFTVGNDIFFAPGEFAPETDAGKELLAHELTHVVQQDTGAARQVMRATPSASPAGNSASSAPSGGAGSGGAPTPGAAEYRVTVPLQIPPIKSRHSPTYATKAWLNCLRRPRGYSSATRATAQRSNWDSGVPIDLSNASLRRYRSADGAWNLPLQSQGGATANTVTAASDGDMEQLLRMPTWDAFGAPNVQFQVDHMVEFQLGGQDDISNLELLNQAYNGSVGTSFDHEINKAIRTNLGQTNGAPPAVAGLTIPSPPTPAFIKDNYDVVFTAVQARGRESGRAEKDSRFWSKSAIQSLEHVTHLLPGAQGNLAGTATRVVLQSPTGSLVIGRFPVNGATLQVPSAHANAIAGFTIETVNLGLPVGNLGGTTTPENTPAGQLIGALNLGPAVTFPNGNRHSLAVVKAKEEFALKIASTSVAGPNPNSASNPNSLVPATFEPLSPMEMSDFTFGKSVYARASIQPSHPALSGLRLPAQVRDGRIGLFHTIDASSLAERLRMPGLSIDAASITFGYDGNDFSVAGGAEFTVRDFGQGHLDAMVDTAGKFQLEGGFCADTRLFDRADVSLWYRSTTGFGGSGTLAITTPNKIRGIQSANLQLTYDQGCFNATGTVEPNIPGVQQAGLRMQYSEAEGLLINGNLQLTANPAIRSGAVDVTLRKRDDAWKVSATGTAQPAIPGIDSQLNVSYDDGAFLAEFSGAFQRGMLSGRASVGATNRTLGADGRPTGEPAPNAPLIVYGDGTATVRIAPWLQGTAGIRFSPNGEVNVAGEIGLPSQVEIFSLKQIDKQLFGMATQIPVFPGIVAEVGGNLSANASIGPGVLDRCRIGIEYNPAQEQNTHVTGDAHLNIPAQAGVRLAARAGIGVGITGASATGGLEVGGTLGIGGAAEAAVHIDWMPSKGLAVDAEGYLHAEPKFKFDVSGYVSVGTALFDIYDNRWELAAYEFGSNLSFGVRFPIHYREGQPFDVSLDDVQFEVPDVDPGAIVSQLGEQIF